VPAAPWVTSTPSRAQPVRVAWAEMADLASDQLKGTQAGQNLNTFAGRGAHQMAGLVGTTVLADLTPVAAEAGAAEGDPRPVYTWTSPSAGEDGMVRSYTPSDGGAPRLVVAAAVGGGATLCVWDTGTGAFLGALQGPGRALWSLVTYQRPSDARPRIAAGSNGGHLSIWDGDDLHVLHTVAVNGDEDPVQCLAVYEEPTSGRTRLVTG
jgi:WD40 repeat protein